MPHKLLLADDSVTIQRVIELTFADENVQVLAVGDGKKAIASIERDPPDIVLADIGMPGRDGYDVAAFIKGKAELAHIPVLLLTGAFEPIDEARARAVRCDGVLVKPFEPQMVINRVKDLLAGRRHAKPASTPPEPPPLQPAVSPAEFDAARTTPRDPAAGPSLEDYFDRLDAAFATLESSQAEAGAVASAPPKPPAPGATPALEFAQPAQGMPSSGAAGYAPADGLAGWDPDLGGSPARAPLQAAPPAETAAASEAVPSPATAAQSKGAPAPGTGTPPQPAPVPAPTAAPSEIAAPQTGWAPQVPPAERTDAAQGLHASTPEDASASQPSVASQPAPEEPVHEDWAAHAAALRASSESKAPARSVGPSSPKPSGLRSPAAPEPVAPPPQQAALAAPALPMPSLADAFAALLSAEQARPISAGAFTPAPASAAVSDEAVEAIVRRVIAGMGEQVVRDTVLDVAERLVREEIERIKSHG